MRSLLYFCVPCGCLALASESVVAGGEAAPIGEVQALGQTFAVWNPEQFNAIMRELQPTIGPSDDARTLYVHLAGSIEGMFPRIFGVQIN